MGDGGIHYYPYNGFQRSDFTDAEQVADAMRIAAAFFHVPPFYAGAVGEVTTGIMQAVDPGLAELPQPWADAYCYVAASICERIGAQSTAEAQP